MADANSPKRYTNNTMVNLANWLLKQQKPNAFDEAALTKQFAGLDADIAAEQIAKQMALKETGKGVTLGQLGQLGVGAVKAHPYKSLALAGSAAGNMKLSEKRAKAVYDALIANGVSADQISYKAMGGQDNLWENSDALTRVVVIEVAK